MIVNKSRAQWRSMVRRIPLHIDDLEKIPLLSEDIKTMLKSNSNVFLEKEAPYCFLSRIERSYAELTLGCNLKQMVCLFLCQMFLFQIISDFIWSTSINLIGLYYVALHLSMSGLKLVNVTKLIFNAQHYKRLSWHPLGIILV